MLLQKLSLLRGRSMQRSLRLDGPVVSTIPPGNLSNTPLAREWVNHAAVLLGPKL